MTARRNISQLRESIPKDQKVSRFVLQERAFPGASADFPVSHVSKPCAIPAGPRFPMFVAVLVACLVVISPRLGLALWFDGFDLQILAGSTPSMLFAPRRNTILWFLERILLYMCFVWFNHHCWKK